MIVCIGLSQPGVAGNLEGTLFFLSSPKQEHDCLFVTVCVGKFGYIRKAVGAQRFPALIR